MKNHFALFLLLIVLVTGCKKTEPALPLLYLKGQIEQTHDSSFIAIIQTGINTFIQDTVTVKENHFELRYPTPADSLVKVNLLSGNKVYSVYMAGNDTLQVKIAGDSLQVSGKLKPFSLWSIQNYLLNPHDSLRNYPPLIRNEIETYRANQSKDAIGKRIPYVLFKDIKDKNISTLEAKGQYRLITFWATWDSLSVNRVKALPEIARKMDRKGLEFINVSLDANDSIWREQVKKLNLPGYNIRLQEGFADTKAQTLGVRTVPENRILTPESIVIEKNIFGNELQQYLEKEITITKASIKADENKKNTTLSKTSRR
ncbi:MAG: thioredoxin-like domain-containing protein [Bacteroidales bacterium]